jgi:hypothetical protein
MDFLATLNKFRSVLPLKINEVEWIDPQLIIQGEGWSFVIASSWRIIKERTIEIGYTSENAIDKILHLKQLSIIEAKPQSSEILCDFSLHLSDKRILEFFSTDGLEPWSIHIDNIGVFANPSDERWVG